MASIAIAKKHRRTHRKAKDVAEKIARDLNQRYDLQYAWDGDNIDFRRPGLTGRMQVAKDQIALDVSLGFLLSALKPTIEKEINAQLDRLLAEKASKA